VHFEIEATLDVQNRIDQLFGERGSYASAESPEAQRHGTGARCLNLYAECVNQVFNFSCPILLDG
jgi:hypothetical protein